jgi:hypothetical protein
MMQAVSVAPHAHEKRDRLITSSISGGLAILFFWLANSLHRKLRRLKPPPGICIRCGYDLRATPDRCPECGAVPLIAKVKA